MVIYHAKVKQEPKNGNHNEKRVENYYVDVEKCKCCPFKEGSKFKTYSVKIKYMDYIDTEEFTDLYK